MNTTFTDYKQIMDNPAVRRIIAYAAFDDSPEGIAKIIKKYQSDPNLHFYAWVDNNEVLGICGYEVNNDKVEIHLISVDENARGRGIGGAMITALREKYCKDIEAETDADAVGFYRKCGFETIEFMHETRGKRYTCLLKTSSCDVKNCSCPKTECPNHSNCTSCVAKHREAGNLPFCLRGKKEQIYSILAIFPTPNIEKTSEFYVNVMGFRAVEYLDVEEPHICLYRDKIEIVLLKANTDKVHTHRELYGYGEDAYFITDEQETLLNEFKGKGAKIVRELWLTDYNNREFIVEDIDGRWLVFGIKEK